MLGADLLVRELQARGVPFVSLLPGNGLDPFLAAADEAGLRLVDTHNEQAASYMADAYARLTGRVGVCAVSSGVAHVNALAGVLNAYYDGAPLLLISGSSPADTLNRGGFQDLDQVALARPLCKYAELVTRPERIPQAVHEAFAAATSGRPGPVHLTITIDALMADAGPDVRSPFGTRGAAQDRAAIAAEDARRVARLLAEAKRPVLVAGSGVFFADGGEALRTLADLTRTPVVTPIWDRGVVDQPMDEYLGVIGAASGEPELLPQADLLVLLGARVDYRVRYMDTPPLAEGVRLVRISVEPDELAQGADAQVAVLADPRSALEGIAEAWQAARYTPHEAWLAQAKAAHAAFYGRWAGEPELLHGCMTGAHILHALRDVITDDTIVLVDGGNIGQWAHMTLGKDRYPGHWLTCGASGVIGWGIPGAMAAALTFPGRPILLLSGDGSIGFALPEFESAARQGLRFVAVVADDREWGIVASGQRKAREGRTTSCELGPVDYTQVAAGFGGVGVAAQSPEQIAASIRHGFARNKPTLVQVPIASLGPAD
ncbi:MAG: thiamine pyrophosphate-binding protein [Anaerolineae bacterium]